jgi:hypothetical protein
MTQTVRSLFMLAIVMSVAACTGPAADVPPTPPPAAAAPAPLPTEAIEPVAAPAPEASPAVPLSTAPVATDRLTVYKSLGRTQCEEGGETPETLAARLKAAGVEATPAGCADDGMMYGAMCGGGTGHLGLFDIAATDAAAAAKAGFRPFSDLPDASRQPCPGTPEAPQKK